MRIISHQIENTNNEIEIIKKNQIENLDWKVQKPKCKIHWRGSSIDLNRQMKESANLMIHFN